MRSDNLLKENAAATEIRQLKKQID